MSLLFTGVGNIVNIEEKRMGKSGRPYTFIWFETIARYSQTLRMTIFENLFEKANDMYNAGVPVVIGGEVTSWETKKDDGTSSFNTNLTCNYLQMCMAEVPKIEDSIIQIEGK